MARSEFPLTLSIKAVDKATATLRSVNARIAEATAPARKLGNSFKALGKEAGLPQIVDGFKGVGGAVRNVGSEILGTATHLAALAGGAGFAFFSIARGAMAAGDDLATMAQRVGLGVDAYAQLRYAADQSDVSAEDFNSAMDKFNKNLGMAKAGTGPMVEFLNKVGPAFGKQVRGAKSTEQALGLMMQAFEKIKDPQRRAALSAEMFGKTGLQLGQWLGTGGKAIDALRKHYFDLAGSQEEFANNASDLDNATKDTAVAFEGLRNAAAGALFPALTALSKALTGVLGGNRGKLKEWAQQAGAAINDWIKGGGVDRLVKGLGDIATTVGKVIDFFGGFKNTAIAVGVVLNSGLIVSVFSLGSALFSAGGALIGFIATMAPFIVAAAPFIAAAIGIGAAGYEIYKHWGDIKFFFKDLWGSIVFYATQAWDKLKPIVDKVANAMAFTPIGLMLKGGSFVADKLLGHGDSPRPQLGATTAAPPPAAASKSEATVKVDFSNLPKGARVSQDKSGNMLMDLSMGYSMVGGS